MPTGLFSYSARSRSAVEISIFKNHFFHNLLDILIPCYTFLTSKDDTEKDQRSPWLHFPTTVASALQLFSNKHSRTIKTYLHNEEQSTTLIKQLKSELYHNNEQESSNRTYKQQIKLQYDYCYQIRLANSNIKNPKNNPNLNCPETCTCMCSLTNDTRKNEKNTGDSCPSEKVRCDLCFKWWDKECVKDITKKWNWGSSPFEEGEIKPKRATRNAASQHKVIGNNNLIGKFICPRCQKSSRPTPEQLLTLLISLEVSLAVEFI